MPNLNVPLPSLHKLVPRPLICLRALTPVSVCQLDLFAIFFSFKLRVLCLLGSWLAICARPNLVFLSIFHLVLVQVELSTENQLKIGKMSSGTLKRMGEIKISLGKGKESNKAVQERITSRSCGQSNGDCSADSTLSKE